jgi:hypothetical protein
MLSFENLKKLFPIKTQLESVTMSDSGKRGTAVSTTIRKWGLTPKLKSEIVVYLSHFLKPTIIYTRLKLSNLFRVVKK